MVVPQNRWVIVVYSGKSQTKMDDKWGTPSLGNLHIYNMSKGPKVYLSVKLTSCLTIYQLVIIYQLSISYLSPFYRLSISYPCYPILSCPVPSHSGLSFARFQCWCRDRVQRNVLRLQGHPGAKRILCPVAKGGLEMPAKRHLTG
jgi:hypothetical protein